MMVRKRTYASKGQALLPGSHASTMTQFYLHHDCIVTPQARIVNLIHVDILGWVRKARDCVERYGTRHNHQFAHGVLRAAVIVVNLIMVFFVESLPQVRARVNVASIDIYAAAVENMFKCGDDFSFPHSFFLFV